MIPGNTALVRDLDSNHGDLAWRAHLRSNCPTSTPQRPGLPHTDMRPPESATCVVVTWISAGALHRVCGSRDFGTRRQVCACACPARLCGKPTVAERSHPVPSRNSQTMSSQLQMRSRWTDSTLLALELAQCGAGGDRASAVSACAGLEKQTSYILMMSGLAARHHPRAFAHTGH